MKPERVPLLKPDGKSKDSTPFSKSKGAGYGTQTKRTRSRTVSSLRIARHITLPHAIGIMVGTIAGTGIFVSPTGVTQQVGSVGTTLILWAVSGLFSLLLALCYAELGTALPLAGGDYAYINYVLGPVPAFLCLWLMVVLLGPCTISVSGRTIAAYLNTLLGLECYNSLTIFIGLWLTAAAAALNCRSVKWTAQLVTLFSIGKVFALGVIILVGFVRLSQGHIGSLTDPFDYSITNPGSIILGFLPAFFTFGGWDTVAALAEEMVNPRRYILHSLLLITLSLLNSCLKTGVCLRDLPIAAVVSLLLVTSIYLLVNVAYFTALTPLEFVTSDAAAVLFAERVMPSVVFIVPIFVMVSSAGSTLNLLLVCPRWGFAGGRDGAIPEVLSYVHIKHLTPVPSILLTAALAMFFCLAVFFNLQDILNIASLITQIKIAISLAALLILKRREPDKPSTITVHPVLVTFSLIILLVIIAVPLWQAPVISWTAVGIFLLGLPLYYIKEHMSTWTWCNNAMDSITKVLQLTLLVVSTREPVMNVDNVSTEIKRQE